MLKRLCLALAILFLIPINAYGADVSISANSAVVIDARTNDILYSKNQNACLSMASTTKIMTCLLACEANRQNEVITITDEMLYGAIGSLIYLKTGDEISFDDLIKGAMLASGNDAANAIAVEISGSIDSFVELMNKRAQTIGMINTVFETPSGLDEGKHHSTAYDMALLASTAIENEMFKSICSMKSAEITINGNKQTIYNHNKLLSFNDDCIGIKTGFTEKAGRCLVSAFDYEGNKIIIVTLNAPNDWDDHQKLYDIAKKNYKEQIINEKFEIATVGGTKECVKCSASCSLYSKNDVKTIAYYYPFVYTPTNKGEVVGKLEVYDNNMLIKTVDIIVEEDVELWQITK